MVNRVGNPEICSKITRSEKLIDEVCTMINQRKIVKVVPNIIYRVQLVPSPDKLDKCLNK